MVRGQWSEVRRENRENEWPKKGAKFAKKEKAKYRKEYRGKGNFQKSEVRDCAKRKAQRAWREDKELGGETVVRRRRSDDKRQTTEVRGQGLREAQGGKTKSAGERQWSEGKTEKRQVSRKDAKAQRKKRYRARVTSRGQKSENRSQKEKQRKRMAAKRRKTRKGKKRE